MANPHSLSTDVEPNDAGIYKCTVTSKSGKTSYVVTVNVIPADDGSQSVYRGLTSAEILPSQPKDIRLVGSNDSAVSLSWAKPGFEGTGIDSYVIEVMYTLN